VETQPKRSWVVMSLLLAFGAVIASAASPRIGADIYHQYCAVCHGPHGAGDGPVADALRVKPTDLTRLRARNNGKFPELRVLNYIRGDDAVQAHGDRKMPIWGRVFRDESGGHQELVQMRIYAVLKYLEELQAPDSATGQ